MRQAGLVCRKSSLSVGSFEKKYFFIQMASWLRPGANCKKEKKKYLV